MKLSNDELLLAADIGGDSNTIVPVRRLANNSRQRSTAACSYNRSTFNRTLDAEEGAVWDRGKLGCDGGAGVDGAAAEDNAHDACA